MMEKYLIEHSSRSKSPMSYRRDLSLAKHLNGFFGGAILTKITPKDIYKYKIKRREEGASPRTINYELSLMRHAFNLAIKEWEWLKENPVSKVSKEKVNNIKERWLTFEEEEKLLLASPKWLQELIVFSLETGLRQSELLNLQWSQIDLSRQTMTLLEQKNRAKDTLPLNKRAMGVLKEKAKARIESFRWHGLRHTFATRLSQADVDLYKIQKLGRWKEISMVSRYAHHYPESLRDGVEVLDQMREKISTNLAQSGNADTQRIV